MTPLFILLIALLLEISLGGFLGIMQGAFHIYATTFIITAFLTRRERVLPFSFAFGLAADVFLSGINFFGFFLIIYLVLGYFIKWLNTIFLKTTGNFAFLFRFAPAAVLYLILYSGLGGIKYYFLNSAYAANQFFSMNFFIGELIGVLITAMIFTTSMMIIKDKN